ncbi:MAG: efflux transporter outer membrane subunit, partial [Burkholderiaceae bacterium]
MTTKAMIRTPVAAAILAAAMAGCSLTPAYVRPDAPVAATYPGAPAPASSAATTPAATPDWRDFFPDPRLQRLIALALDNNRDLRTAALRIEEARAQYNSQSADLLPNVTLGATASRSRSPFGAGAAGATGTTGTATSTAGAATTATAGRVINTYQVGANLAAYELDFFGRVRSLNEAALDQYLATEEARRAAQISLIASVAQAYLAERSDAEQLALAQQSLEGRQKEYELEKKRFNVGASSGLDLRLSETLVQSARTAALTLQRQQAQALNALTLLVGAPLPPEPQPRTLSEQGIVDDIPPGLPSELLVRRPDIRAAEQQLRSANAQIGAARAAFFPRISLTAGLGTASTQLSDLFDAGSRTWSFVPQLVLPIFDAGRNRANLDLAQVRKNIAVVSYEKTIQTAFREVSDALVARGLLNDQMEAQRATVAA